MSAILPSVSRLVPALFLIAVASVALRASPWQQPAAPNTSAQASGSLEDAKRLHEESQKHIDSRQFKEAAEKSERALAIRRQLLGARHPDVAQSIERLGIIAYYQGDYANAEKLVAEALDIREATLGPDHLDVAESLSDLASMSLVRGDYVRPEALFLRALAIYEKAPASSSADVQVLSADVFNNLGLLYSRRGNNERAESNYLRALDIKQRIRGADHPEVADVAANLGGVYYSSKQFDKAIQSLQRALSIQEKVLPPTHPSLATSSFNLAAVYFDQGDYDNAERLFQRALSIDEQQLDPRHPRLAVRLMGLAEVLRLKGDYARADPLYERVFTIREQALGAGHPLVADALIGRSLLRYATTDYAGAVELLSRGAQLREQTLALVLTAGSEDAKRQYLRSIADETDIAVSLHLGSVPTSMPAATLAFTNVLERKGRSMDAMASHMATLRNRLNEADRDVLNQLSQAQSRLATSILRGVSNDEQRTAVVALRSEIQRLEETVSARSAEFRVVSKSASLTDIERSLPANAALIEFVSYRPFQVTKKRAEAFASPRYAAYVLRRDGIVASFDLGDAAQIDRQVQQLRAALSTPTDGAVRQVARSLHERVLQPLEATLNDVEHLVISPDGALNLIPFAALVDARGEYLVERRTISYVTSGRDLPRLVSEREGVRAASAPVVIANPQFQGLSASNASAPTPAATRGIDATVLEQALKFDALPATAEEATALAKVLPDARVYTGVTATEALLKSVKAPSILHIATHGFFLRPAATAPGPSDTRGLVANAPPAGSVGEREDALVLSGLALAGANQRWSGSSEDGILTALEAASLDLWGTRMVVLSACETGVGDARNGEGVYGLRRALVLAGSESQVMSLWQVADEATRDLMISYYQRLRTRESRVAALRQVQLAMLKGGRNRDHPYYWASFILSGDWRPAFD